MFNSGDYFGTRYQIIEEIGQGGMGKVFKAKDLELNEIVALKTIKPELGSSPDIIARFKRELRLAREINHDNIIRIHDLGEIEGIKFISMKYIHGQTLKEIIQTTGKLTIDKAIDVTRQICSALEAAHSKGIIHRDLKPQNIMLDKSGKVYVLDFGIARSVSGTSLTESGAILGTPDFMSPEQFLGHPIDQRSDIWSLGIMMYEMVTGSQPFKEEYREAIAYSILNLKPVLPSLLNPQVPKEVEKIIMKCLEKKPENRFASTSEICALLPANIDKRIKTRTSKKKIFKYAALFIFLIAVSIVAFNLYMSWAKKRSVKEIETLKPAPVETTSSTVQTESSYQKNFAQAQSYYQAGQYENALNSIELARKEKSTTELTDLETLVNRDWDKQKAEEAKKQQANQGRQRKATEAERTRDIKYQQNFDQAKSCYRAGQYENALHSVDLARIEKSTTELIEFETLVKKEWDKYKEDQEKQKNALAAEKKKDTSYQQLVDQAKSQYQSGQYENALHSIELARIEKSTKELADFETVVKREWDKYKEDQEKQKNALAEEKKKDTSYQQLVDQAKSQYQSGQFENALRSIKLAEIGMTTPELTKLEDLVKQEIDKLEKRKQEEAGRQKAEDERKKQEEEKRIKQDEEQRKLQEEQEKQKQAAEEEKKKAGQIWPEPKIGMQFVYVPSGNFLMGSDNGVSDEKPVHRVELDGFWLGKYEVTQKQWDAVMRGNPADFFSKGDTHPVEQVSWDDVQKFIRRLNQLTGLVFRLPTEAEWEYACKAGMSGETYGDIALITWYDGNSKGETHAVGQKKANAWGLYDMLGNVGEWCQDWYGPGYYTDSPSRNPPGLFAGTLRVYRGGSWFSKAQLVRASVRLHQVPSTKSNKIGFRLAIDKNKVNVK